MSPTLSGDLTQIEREAPACLNILQPEVIRARLNGSVDGGRLFTANLTQVSSVFQFNVRTFFRAIFQYTRIDRTPGLYVTQDPADVDPRSEHLFTQLLFSYKLNPQTVIFVGYSDNALADRTYDLTRADRTFFLKLGYAWIP